MAKIVRKKADQQGGGVNAINAEKPYKTVDISDLIVDDRNANKGTDLGRELLKKSVKKHGVGRGVLVDKNLKLIGGNHTVKELVKQGYKRAIVIPTDGDTLVVTQRIDIEKDSKEGHELAIADNRVNQANLLFDAELLGDLEAEFNLDLGCMAMDLDELSAGIMDEEDEPIKKPSNAKATGSGDNMEGGSGAGTHALIVALSDGMRELLDSFKADHDIELDSEAFYLMLKMVTE